MFAYWLLFGIPACASLFEKSGSRIGPRGKGVLFFLAIVLIGLLVGLRYEVGGDWFTYMAHLLRASSLGFAEIATAGDPGYVLLNWLTVRLGGDIWWVNLVCAGLFSWGLLSFARTQPRPWLTLTIAVPYLVIVVAMGYTRQGVAIGLVMQALVALGKGRSTVPFVLWVIAAATFHKSAVLLIPIAALAQRRGRWWTAIWVGCASVLGYFTLLESGVEKFLYGYIEQEYESSGATIRITMNAIPALLFMIYGDRFKLHPNERHIWRFMALLALGLVPVLVLSPSSTAVDRIALYFIPIQLMVFSHAPDVFGRSEPGTRLLAILVVAYYAVVQFIWLNYASNAAAWVPYRLYSL